MDARHFLARLFQLPEPSGRPQPARPKTSEDYAQEIETEKELRRGIGGVSV